MKKVHWWVWLIIIVVAVGALLLGACGDPQQSQPVVCATYQEDGVWKEEDGERVDDDPCDLDDAFEVEHLKTPPAKKKSEPIGGKKKRF